MSEPMSDERLAEIRKREQAATPGPLSVDHVPNVGKAVSDQKLRLCIAVEDGWVSRADAEFIAHAREDVPALRAEVERLREENRRHQETIEAASRGWRIEVAEVERLRDQLKSVQDHAAWVEDRRRTAERERDEAREQVKRVRALAQDIRTRVWQGDRVAALIDRALDGEATP